MKKSWGSEISEDSAQKEVAFWGNLSLFGFLLRLYFFLHVYELLAAVVELVLQEGHFL